MSMTDQDILDFFIDRSRGKIYESKININYLTNKAQEYKEYLDNRYPEPFDKYSEIIARIYHNIDIKPRCKVCGKLLKFRSLKSPYGIWCNQKCQLRDADFIKWRSGIIDYKTAKENRRKTCLEKYGDPNYRNIEKSKSTNLERYGTESYLSTNNENLKRGSKENLKKVKRTNLKKYGVEYFAQTDEWKKLNRETCLEKYGVESYSTTDEYKEKTYKTKKKNNTFNTSSIEEKLVEYFKLNNIDHKYQYKSSLYPYMCDFYFPSTDSYVEIQGNWTHGGRPFDENNQDDITQLESWKSKGSKYYNIAINVWTKSDVQKRELAKLNKLKFFEIFSIDFDYIITELKNNNVI